VNFRNCRASWPLLCTPRWRARGGGRGHRAALPAQDRGRRAAGRSGGDLCGARDKLDTLTGIFGIGLAPSGDKDPFGLRRAALGAVRILAEKSLALDVLELLTLARGHFAAGVVADSVAQDLHAFMLERLKPYLRDKLFEADEIDAVLSLNPTRFDQVLPRLKALQAFRALPQAEATGPPPTSASVIS